MICAMLAKTSSLNSIQQASKGMLGMWKTWNIKCSLWWSYPPCSAWLWFLPHATIYSCSVIMVFGERVASAVAASIVGIILASQYCASQMTGNFIHTDRLLHMECCIVFIMAHVHIILHASTPSTDSLHACPTFPGTLITRLASTMTLTRYLEAIIWIIIDHKNRPGCMHTYIAILITITHHDEQNFNLKRNSGPVSMFVTQTRRWSLVTSEHQCNFRTTRQASCSSSSRV